VTRVTRVLNCRQRAKIRKIRQFRFLHLDIGHFGRRRSSPATLNHRRDVFLSALKNSLYRTVMSIADPTCDFPCGRLPLCPAAKPDALDPARNDDMNGGIGQGDPGALFEFHNHLIDYQAFPGFGIDTGNHLVTFGA